jgi:hypothetical protein
LHQIASPLVYIVLVAMVVTVAIQNWADAVVTAIVVVFITLIGFIWE